MTYERAAEYQLFWQLTHLTRDKGSLAHDDRVDALAIACGYFAAQMAQDTEKGVEASREPMMKEELARYMQHAIGCSRIRWNRETFKTPVPRLVPVRDDLQKVDSAVFEEQDSVHAEFDSRHGDRLGEADWPLSPRDQRGALEVRVTAARGEITFEHAKLWDDRRQRWELDRKLAKDRQLELVGRPEVGSHNPTLSHRLALGY